MGRNKSVFILKGMTRDTALSRFSAEYAYENMNLRLVSTGENTTGALVSEKGTKLFTKIEVVENESVEKGISIDGIPIGQCVIDDKLILFSHKDVYNAHNIKDYIYKVTIDENDELQCDVLAHADLNFSVDNPIECLADYENSSIQKVYWVDGVNQPRVINVASDKTFIWDSRQQKYNNDPEELNFVREAKFDIGKYYNIVTKKLNSGRFPSGVIQYHFTYFNLYGQESTIMYSTQLLYLSPENRGASPEDIVLNSFEIKIPALSVDTRFEYIRVYSTIRTSVNATPAAYKVVDLKIDPAKDSGSYYTFVDTGLYNESIDYTLLLYKGGDDITASTMAQKDGTLFLGDIKINRPNINNLEYDGKSLQDYFLDLNLEDRPLVIFLSSSPRTDGLTVDGIVYPYESQLLYPKEHETSSYMIKGIAGFKYGEWYRFGFQAQYKTGQWSDVIWLNDAKCDKFPSLGDDNEIKLPYAWMSIPNEIVQQIKSAGYTKLRPVVVFPRFEERTVLCQGVLNPTVFNVVDRIDNQPFAQSSWFFRPSVPFDFDLVNTTPSQNVNGYEYNINHFESGKWVEFRHNKGLPVANQLNSEIQTSTDFYSLYVRNGLSNYINTHRSDFAVDQSIVTMHSPDIEFDDSFLTHDVIKWPKIRIVGYVPITSNSMDIDIQTSTPPKSESDYAGLNKIYMFTNNIDDRGGRQMLSGGFWYDKPLKNIIKIAQEQSGPLSINPNETGFAIYPWHRNGSLNDDDGSDNSRQRYAMLKTKRMSTLRYSYKTVYLSNYLSNTPSYDNLKTADIKVFDNRKSRLVKLDTTEDSIKIFGRNKLNYMGDIDTIISPTTDYNIYITQKLRMLLSDVIDPEDNRTLALYGKYYSDISDETPSSLNSYENLGNIDNPVAYQYLEYRSSSSTSTDPISMRYKSMPHIVIELDSKEIDNKYYQYILPGIKKSDTEYNRSILNLNDFNRIPLWNNENMAYSGVRQDFISIPVGETNSLLWLAELYRDDDDDVLADTRFGGQTKGAFENNLWVVAGEPVEIPYNYNVSLTYERGDTYFQRYDCLKTYPYTTDDQNQIVDILSFMCETRINIDGRYDANRGLESNLHINPENFNLLNNVYSQQDNFFLQRSENPNKLSLNRFKNTVTWTKQKNLGEEIDTWTNLILANTLDFDGDKGRITAIRNFNDTLFVFQEKGIANILYNEKMQISTESGVPIEIANYGRVDGKRYFSTSVGCKNKHSILQTPKGIYFADDYSKGIYMLSQGLEDLTDKLGFHSWAVNNITGKLWNPDGFENIVTYYDSINKDVLFISKDKALAYSEGLGAFSSFYSYGDTPYFAFLEDTGIMLHRDNSETGSPYYLWNYRGGEYNTFFGKLEPYYTEVIVNENQFTTKIFDTAEFVADCFNPEEPDATKSDYRGNNCTPFDTIYAENEYQKGKYELSTLGYRVGDKLFRNVTDVDGTSDVTEENKLYRIQDDEDYKYYYYLRVNGESKEVEARSISVNNPSHLKQKFRIWRANIPRNTEKRFNHLNKTGDVSRDRMVSPWIKLKLSKNNPDTNKTVIHNIAVNYYN